MTGRGAGPRARRRPRGSTYAQLDAAAQGEMEALLAQAGENCSCPRCGFTWNPWVAQPPLLGLPNRSPEERELRAADLLPTAARFAVALAERVSETSWDVWLSGVVLLDADRNRLYFAGPDDVVAWVQQRFSELMGTVATELAGRPVGVVVGRWPTVLSHSLGRLRDDAPAPARRPDAGASPTTVATPPEEPAP